MEEIKTMPDLDPPEARQGIDWSKDNIYDAIRRPDLKPKCPMETQITETATHPLYKLQQDFNARMDKIDAELAAITEILAKW